MTPAYITRSPEPVLKKAIAEFPTAVLTGPRQSGKTTLLKRLCAKRVEKCQKLVPIEVKLSATPRPAMASTVKTFRRDLKGKTMPGYVIHPGDATLPLGSGVTALPFAEL